MASNASEQGENLGERATQTVDETAQRPSRKRARSQFALLKEKYVNKLRVVEKHIGELRADFSAANFLNAIDADLSTIPQQGATQSQKQERERLLAEKSDILEPELFYGVVTPFKGDNHYWRSSMFEDDPFLKRASDSLLDAIANTAERIRISSSLPQSIRDFPLCRGAPTAVSNPRVRAKPQGYHDKAKSQLRKLWTALIQPHSHQEGKHQVCDLDLCPPEVYSLCRQQSDGSFPCGGRCAGARQALGWPSTVPLINPRNKVKDYENQHLEPLLNHYASRQDLQGIFDAPERPAQRTSRAPRHAQSEGPGSREIQARAQAFTGRQGGSQQGNAAATPLGDSRERRQDRSTFRRAPGHMPFGYFLDPSNNQHRLKSFKPSVEDLRSVAALHCPPLRFDGDNADSIDITIGLRQRWTVRIDEFWQAVNKRAGFYQALDWAAIARESGAPDMPINLATNNRVKKAFQDRLLPMYGFNAGEDVTNITDMEDCLMILFGVPHADNSLQHTDKSRALKNAAATAYTSSNNTGQAMTEQFDASDLRSGCAHLLTNCHSLCIRFLIDCAAPADQRAREALEVLLSAIPSD